MGTNTELDIQLKERQNHFKMRSFSKAALKLVDKSKLLDYCIKKAWVDAMQRENKLGLKNSIVLQNKEKIKGKLKNEILNKKYVSDFDEWHRKMCTNCDNGMRVGLWQKLINMTFKYLYCVKEYFTDINFTNCHCPIDSVIAKRLKELMNERDDNYDLVSSIAMSGKINWNNITYEQYESFENIVKEKTKTQGITKLEFDFLYW